MAEVNFRNTEFGIIDHGNGEYEVVKHVVIVESAKEAHEKADELFEAL